MITNYGNYLNPLWVSSFSSSHLVCLPVIHACHSDLLSDFLKSSCYLVLIFDCLFHFCFPIASTLSTWYFLLETFRYSLLQPRLLYTHMYICTCMYIHVTTCFLYIILFPFVPRQYINVPCISNDKTPWCCASLFDFFHACTDDSTVMNQCLHSTHPPHWILGKKNNHSHLYPIT